MQPAHAGVFTKSVPAIGLLVQLLLLSSASNASEGADASADPAALLGTAAQSFVRQGLLEERDSAFKNLSYAIILTENAKPLYYLEGVYPLREKPDSNEAWFIQPRVSYDGTDDDVYNLGIGNRRYCASVDALIGWNVFADYQRDPGFGRIGVGGDWLGANYDVRVNSYFAVGPRRRVEETDSSVIYESAVNGMDAELGAAIPGFRFVKIYGGYEFYDLKHGDNSQAWTGRVEFKPAESMILNLRYKDDRDRDEEWSVDIRFAVDFERIPGLFVLDPEPRPAASAKDRFYDRVERNHRIVTEKYGINKSSGILFEIGRSG